MVEWLNWSLRLLAARPVEFEPGCGREAGKVYLCHSSARHRGMLGG